MLRKIARLAARLRAGSLERRDYAEESSPAVGNVDALAAAGDRDLRGGEANTGSSNYPPGYVKPYDEGRPKH